MFSLDLSEEVIRFAECNENDIKTAVRKEVDEYFSCTVTENYKAKFLAGRAEHGCMTVYKILTENWLKHSSAELQDAFWYMALRMFRDDLQANGAIEQKS
jgi:undecaprenyl pyrophosphate synthase